MLTLVSVLIVCSGDCSTSYSYPTVVCPSLSLTNGMVFYSDPPQGVDGVATHSCDIGYTLSGSDNITCQASGSWETPPVCSRESFVLIHKCVVWYWPWQK